MVSSSRVNRSIGHYTESDIGRRSTPLSLAEGIREPPHLATHAIAAAPPLQAALRIDHPFGHVAAHLAHAERRVPALAGGRRRERAPLALDAVAARGVVLGAPRIRPPRLPR